jgi:hypothetical protein
LVVGVATDVRPHVDTIAAVTIYYDAVSSARKEVYRLSHRLLSTKGKRVVSGDLAFITKVVDQASILLGPNFLLRYTARL